MTPSGTDPAADNGAAGVALRTFAWKDLDQVLDLWRTAGPGIHLGPSDTPEELRNKWLHDPELFLVAESAGRVIAAVLGGYDGRRGIVYHLAVARAFRRKGVGRRMMDELETRLRTRGCYKSYLLATPENREAIEFYRRLGWDVMDMVLMGKEFR